MKWLKLFICVAVFISPSLTLHAQQVEIIKQSSFNPPATGRYFNFIEPSSDSTAFTFVATIRVTDENGKYGFGKLYSKLKEKAMSLGANAFKLNNYTRADSVNAEALTLDTYFATYGRIIENAKNHPMNTVYIFGNPDKSGKDVSFRLNNKKMEVKGGTYYKYEIPQEKEAKISKGGLTGATLWITWKENKPASFLTLTGFGLGNVQPPVGQVGISFGTGRINRMDENMGYLLISLLSVSD